MLELGPVELVWEGGSVCMIGGVGLKSIPRSNNGMGESSGNECAVGGEMLDPGHRCGVGEGMLGLRDGYKVGGEGLGLGTT